MTRHSGISRILIALVGAVVIAAAVPVVASASWFDALVVRDTTHASIVGDGGMALVTSNGGATWTPRATGSAGRLRALAPLGTSGLLAGGEWDGTLRASLDNGLTWSSRSIADNAIHVLGIRFTDASNGWAVGQDSAITLGVVYRTTDGGVTWTESWRGVSSQASGDEQPAATDTECFALDVVGDTVWVTAYAWAATTNQTRSLIVRTADGGATWEHGYSGTAQRLDAIDFVDATHGWAVGTGRVIQVTSNGGSWSSQLPAISGGADLHGISMTGLSHGVAVGDSGTILRFDGTSWTARPSGTTASLRAVGFASDARHGWAVGDNVVLATADGGLTWSAQTGNIARRTLTMSASRPPATVAYGGTARFSASLTAPDGTPARGRAVRLESSSDGVRWTANAAPVSSILGTYTATASPSQRTWYRLAFPGDTFDAPVAATSAIVTPRVYLPAPTVPTVAYRARTFTVAGSLRPRHTAGARSVRLLCSRYESGRWVLRATVYAVNADYSTYTRYTGRVTLPYRGTWRIVAYHPADGAHAATYASERRLSVR